MRSLLGLALLVSVAIGCDAKVGPFYPTPPVQHCDSDVKCPDHSACRYPSAHDKQAMCMTGRESDVYGWSPTAGPGE